MASGIRLEGMDFADIEDFIRESEIDENKQRAALKKAVKVANKEVANAMPNGKSSKKVKQKSAKVDFGAEETLYIDTWYWIFQEFRNRKQKGKYIGTFERAINKTNDTVMAVLRKELMK